jgi:hypothetical protein
MRVLAVAVLAVVLALSAVQSAFAATELAYDNGSFHGADGPNWGAVRFVLADFGFSGSVRLLKVRFYFFFSQVQEPVRIHVYASDGVTPLCCTPNLDQTPSSGWNEIDLSSRMSAPISGAFYVAREILGQVASGIGHDNAGSVGHSYTGGPGAWTSYDGNFMIRAEVDPVQATGPVGGVLTPVNKLVVFAPYLALLGVVGAVAVIVWKRPDN